MFKRIVLLLVALILSSGGPSALFAEIPENTPENSFQERVVKTFDIAIDLMKSGLREVRENFLTNGALVSYEITDKFLDGQVLLDEVVAWTQIYQTTVPQDVPRFRRIKELLQQKQRLVRQVVHLIGAQTSKIGRVAQFRKEIKTLDRKILFQFKVLKGTLQLIPNKPLPQTAEE
jgi:hypothetical protein